MGLFKKIFNKQAATVEDVQPIEEINIGAFFNRRDRTEASEKEMIDKVLATVVPRPNKLDEISQIRARVLEIREYKDKMYTNNRIYLAQKQREMITAVQER